MREEKYSHVDGYGSMIRVSKCTARKMFYEGYEIVIAPAKANMMFCSWIWWHPYRNYDNLDKTSGRFEEIVNGHEYYHCNSEMGLYSKFFVSQHCYNKYFGITK